VKRYTPILWTRRGERSALRDATQPVKSKLTPLFVVPPITMDFQNGVPSMSIDQHLGTLATDLAQTWGLSPAAIDLFHIDDAARMQDGSHPVQWLTGEAVRVGLPLIPAVSPSRSPDYITAAANVHARDGQGVCLRLSVSEWPSAGGFSPIQTLMSTLNVVPSDVDLVLDLGPEPGRSGSLALQVLRTELASLPLIGKWRRLVVAGTAFPSPLTAAKGQSLIDRTEWSIYSILLSNGRPQRIPSFGDYAIANPDPGGDVDPRMMSISAQLRYTVPDAWLIAKGDLFKGRGGSGRGGQAMSTVAARLVQSTHFARVQHCAGDRWIREAAAGTVSGGNPETWRRVGTVHHLTQVTDDLAKLYAVLGLP
jgi:hypothetical protein